MGLSEVCASSVESVGYYAGPDIDKLPIKVFAETANVILTWDQWDCGKIVGYSRNGAAYDDSGQTTQD